MRRLLRNRPSRPGRESGRGLSSTQLDSASRGESSRVAFDARIVNKPFWADEAVDAGRTVLVVSYDPPEGDLGANPGSILVEVSDDATTAKREEFQAGRAVVVNGALVPPGVILATSVSLASAGGAGVIRLLRRLRLTCRREPSRTPRAAVGVPPTAAGQGSSNGTGRSPAADEEPASAQLGRLDGCQVNLSGRIAAPPLREVGSDGDELITLLVAYDPPGDEGDFGFTEVERGFIQVETSESRLDGEVPAFLLGDLIHFGGTLAFPPGVVKARFIRPFPFEEDRQN